MAAPTETPAAALERYTALYEGALVRARIARLAGEEKEERRWEEIAVYWCDRKLQFSREMEHAAANPAARIPGLIEDLDLIERHMRDTTALMVRETDRLEGLPPGERAAPHLLQTQALLRRHLEVLEEQAALVRAEIGKRVLRPELP